MASPPEVRPPSSASLRVHRPTNARCQPGGKLLAIVTLARLGEDAAKRWREWSEERRKPQQADGRIGRIGEQFSQGNGTDTPGPPIPRSARSARYDV